MSDKMEVELAEQSLKTMEHSEQHYFKRYVDFFLSLLRSLENVF